MNGDPHHEDCDRRGRKGWFRTDKSSWQKEGHDIVVIDSNKAVLREAVEELDVMVVHGNGATLGVQELADVEHSDLLIAATPGRNQSSLLHIARKLGCPTPSPRSQPEYAHQLYFLKDELGLSMMVNPELAAAK